MADGSTSDILSDEELLDNCGLEMPLSMQHCKICKDAKVTHLLSCVKSN